MQYLRRDKTREVEELTNEALEWLKVNYKSYKRQTQSNFKGNSSIILALYRLRLKHIN